MGKNQTLSTCYKNALLQSLHFEQPAASLSKTKKKMGSCWVALQIIQDNGRHSWKITTPCLKLHQYPFGRQKFKVQEIWQDLVLKGRSSRSVTSRHPKKTWGVQWWCKYFSKESSRDSWQKVSRHASQNSSILQSCSLIRHGLRIYTKFWRC